MKTKIELQLRRKFWPVLCGLLGAVVLGGIANAQTYARIAINNFALNGGVYLASTNITIATNQLVSSTSFSYTSNAVTRVWADVQFSGGQLTHLAPCTTDPVTLSPSTSTEGIFTGLLGPCTLKLSATASTTPAEVDVVLKFESVNTTPVPLGVVQSPNQTVTVNLQSSTNLTTWATATNGIYTGNGNYRFFRASLQ